MNKLWDVCGAIASLAIVTTITTSSYAQTVALKGLAGSKALVAINNGQPFFMKTGKSKGGVTLTKVDSTQAIFEISGKKVSLKIGTTHQGKGGVHAPRQHPAPTVVASNKVSVNQNNSNSGRRVVVPASGGGSHYITEGLYDGKPVKYILDTGASMVSMSLDDALRLGVNYREGREAIAETAGGQVKSYVISADSITVGGITINDVDTIVATTSFGQPKTLLLGQSFLSKVKLIQEKGQITLEVK